MNRSWHAAAALALAAGPLAAQPPAIAPAAAKTPLSYAQLLAEHLAFGARGVNGVALYAMPAGGGPAVLLGRVGTVPAATDPRIGRAAAQRQSSADAAGAIVPLRDAAGATIGALAVGFAGGAAGNRDAYLGRATAMRDEVQLILPKRETLDDPYAKGYDATDTLAQKINQILVARHPDAAVVAIHVTAPGDTKNKVWGINRPNFIGRDSDEIDTDTEKTGRIVMQVIPATHRMEVHMPLLSPAGDVFGTLCTVYFFRTVGEAADYYGRSLGMMEEVRGLMPADRAALFKP